MNSHTQYVILDLEKTADYLNLHITLDEEYFTEVLMKLFQSSVWLVKNTSVASRLMWNT